MKRSRQTFSQLSRLGIAPFACLLLAMPAAPLEAGRSPLDLEREEFLRQAPIQRMEIIPIGVTKTRRATLSDGVLTHDAHVQTVAVTYKKFQGKKRIYLQYRDHYAFNVAAYRLDRLLNLNVVPVSVERRLGRAREIHRDIRGKYAAVTWWVDDVLMMDRERHERGIPPPDVELWNDQMHQLRVFNQLLFNTDPNLGNYLITKDWRLWAIDFTRAFRPNRKLESGALLQRIDRRVYRGLQALTLETLQRDAGPYLKRPERRAVLARRDAILELLAARIAARGEAAVICDRPGH